MVSQGATKSEEQAFDRQIKLIRKEIEIGQ